MAFRHKWKYKEQGRNYPRTCTKCGVKEVIKQRPSKKGPGKVDQVFYQLRGLKEWVEGNAPACTTDE